MRRFICVLLIICLLLAIPAAAADREEGSALKTSEAMIAFIKFYEGFREQAYPDGSGYAIGFGTHCAVADYPDGITIEQADAVLREVLSYMEDAVNSAMDEIGVTLTQNQFDALLSMTFNISSSWLSTSYSLYNMLASGIEQYSDQEIISTMGRYCRYNNVINEAIARRRLAEAKVFLYGDYRTGSTLNYEYEIIDDPSSQYGDNIVFKPEGGSTDCKYSDIYYTDWYFGSVSPLSYLGVIDGYEDGTFRPQLFVTWGEALKLALTGAGYPKVPPTGEHWASGYLSMAVDYGLLTAENDIELDALIDRGQMAELVASAFNIEVTEGASPFADTAGPAANALYHAGVVTGSYDENGALVYKAGDYLRRSELCALIWRASNI